MLNFSEFQRGLFIVLEGVDGVGKSTQAKNLINFFHESNQKCISLSFPDRSTDIGKIINSFLKGNTNVNYETLHLLFSANRWEKQEYILNTLNSGVSIVCDRYAFSGIAYSTGAYGLDLPWCLESDRNLIQPDIVYELIEPVSITFSRLKENEVVETLDIQEKVKNMYSIFRSAPYWRIVDLSTIDSHHSEEMCANKIKEFIQNDLVEYTQNNHIKYSTIEKIGNSTPWK